MESYAADNGWYWDWVIATEVWRTSHKRVVVGGRYPINLRFVNSNIIIIGDEYDYVNFSGQKVKENSMKP